MLLRTAQKKLKLSNKDFATLIGVTGSWLTSYYKGRIKTPISKTSNRILSRLKMSDLKGEVTLKDLCSMRGRGPDFNRYA